MDIEILACEPLDWLDSHWKLNSAYSCISLSVQERRSKGFKDISATFKINPINKDLIGLVNYKHLIGLELIYRVAFGCVDQRYIYHGLDTLFINIYCASQ